MYHLSRSMHDPNGDGEEMLGGDDVLFNLAQAFSENGIVTKVHSSGDTTCKNDETSNYYA